MVSHGQVQWTCITTNKSKVSLILKLIDGNVRGMKIYLLSSIIAMRSSTGLDDAPPSSLMDSIVSPKVKTTKGKGVGVRSLVHSTSGVEGGAGAPGWD